MITIEQFRDALDRCGVKNKISGKSLAVRDCPSCGSKDFKVLFNRLEFNKRARRDDDPFIGKCFRGDCLEGYSSISYLMAVGLPRDEVLGLHGKRSVESVLASLLPDLPGLDRPTAEKKTEIVAPLANLDTKRFLPLGTWPEHPADQYAMRRGAPVWAKSIMIDTEANAVVFLVIKQGQVIGWQKRYVRPLSPKDKTRTSNGFSKSSNILEFPRPDAAVVVCEGPFTALAAWHYGYHAICTFGAAVSDAQLAMIFERIAGTDRRLGISFDLDGAGRKGLDRVRRAAYWLGIELFVVKPGGGENDLNDSWMKGVGFTEEQPNWPEPAIPILDLAL